MKSLFADVLRGLTPTDAEHKTFLKHGKSLQKIVDGCGAKSIIPIGSRRRHTALKNVSDYDLLVLFPRKLLTRGGHLISSTAALSRIRKAVSSRYPQTSVRTDKQAVVVSFQSTGASIDLVPAYFAEPGTDFEKPARNYPVYGIPDGRGGWNLSSPHAYDALLTEADAKSGHKLRKVSQLLKFWTNCYSPALPLSSFAYEMLLVQSDVCRPGRSYQHCLWEAFKLLALRDTYRLRDPLNLSKSILLTRTPRQATLIRRRARLARIDARLAVRGKDSIEAFQAWSRVFNHKVGTASY
jgi:Second Messenger Oligonucleotide or Dinucleotide Synthetase domain